MALLDDLGRCSPAEFKMSEKPSLKESDQGPLKNGAMTVGKESMDEAREPGIATLPRPTGRNEAEVERKE